MDDLIVEDGRVQSQRLCLEHVEVVPANRAFRPMVNQLAYDVSELALVTLILARALEKQLVGVPVVLMQQSAYGMFAVRDDSPLREASRTGKSIVVPEREPNDDINNPTTYVVGTEVTGSLGSADVEIASDHRPVLVEFEIDVPQGTPESEVEARESARDVGVFDAEGRLRPAEADRFAEAFGLDVVCFEAPNKASQFSLLDHFGREVRLSNVRLEELLRVEIYRRGLHSDAFGNPRLRPRSPHVASA